MASSAPGSHDKRSQAKADAAASDGPDGEARERSVQELVGAGASAGLRDARGPRGVAAGGGALRRSARGDPHDLRRERHPARRCAEARCRERERCTADPGARGGRRGERELRGSGSRVPARDGPGLAAHARGRSRDRAADRERRAPHVVCRRRYAGRHPGASRARRCAAQGAHRAEGAARRARRRRGAVHAGGAHPVAAPGLHEGAQARGRDHEARERRGELAHEQGDAYAPRCRDRGALPRGDRSRDRRALLEGPLRRARGPASAGSRTRCARSSRRSAACCVRFDCSRMRSKSSR